jgi:hypothetical protein
MEAALRFYISEVFAPFDIAACSVEQGEQRDQRVDQPPVPIICLQPVYVVTE